jgi:uncharacterized protein YkwD
LLISAATTESLSTPTRRRPLPVLLAGLLALIAALVAGPDTASWAAPAAARTGVVGYQAAAFTATNAQRVAHGRVPVAASRCLQRLAVRQAARMARQGRMFHQDLGPVLDRCGLSLAGENVAYGYRSGRSVVRDGWMRSSGHRANILQRRYRLMGIGARQVDGTWYVAQVFGRRAR